MSRKPLLGKKSVQQKLNDIASNEDNNNVINTVSTIAATKIEAMEKFALKPVTKSGKYELEKDYYDSFSFLARRLDKDIQELASEYIFEALKRDLKKYNIPLMKNN